MSKLTFIVASLALVGVLVALVGVSTQRNLQSTPTASVQDLWAAWKVQYTKQYATTAEEAHRFQTFSDNYDFVTKWNADPTQTSWVGLNQFADYNTQEFSELQGCLNMPQVSHEQHHEPMEEDLSIQNMPELPASWDWRAKGAVTPVKNQQQCGSCWAFSTTGTLEGLHFILTKNLLSFSEQQIVDCSGSYGNFGCDGGWPFWALEYTAAQGIELESDYEYVAVDTECTYNASLVQFKNTGYQNVTKMSGPALASAVVKQPISVCVEADQPVFQLYTGGIITSSSCGTQLDHAILAVGYSVNASQPYWIVKNSWGTSWGLSGYLYIAKGNTTNDPGVCGINSNPTYATGKKSEISL